MRHVSPQVDRATARRLGNGHSLGLSELAGRVRQQHERITLIRNGEPKAVLVSVDDREGLEMTQEIPGDTEAVARISEMPGRPGP